MSAEEIYNIIQNIEKGECHRDSKEVQKLQNMALAVTRNLNESERKSEFEMKLRSAMPSLQHKDLVNLELILPAQVSQMSSQSLIEIINMLRPDTDYSSVEDQKMPLKEQILQQTETFSKKEAVLDEEAMDTNNRGLKSCNKKEEPDKDHDKRQAKKTATPQINMTPKVSLPFDEKKTLMEQTQASEKGKTHKTQEDTSKGASTSKKNSSVTNTVINQEKDGGEKTTTTKTRNSTLGGGSLSCKNKTPVMKRTFESAASGKGKRKPTKEEISKGVSSSEKNVSVTKTSTNGEQDGKERTTTQKTGSITLSNNSLLFKKGTPVTRNTYRKGTGEKKITSPYKESTRSKGSLTCKNNNPVMKRTFESVASGKAKSNPTKEEISESSCEEQTNPMKTSVADLNDEGKTSPRKEEIGKAVSTSNRNESVANAPSKNGQVGGNKITTLDITRTESNGSTMNRNETKNWATKPQTGKEESKRQQYTSLGSKCEIDCILDPLSEWHYLLCANPNDGGLVIMPVIQQTQNMYQTTPQLLTLIRSTTPGATPASLDRTVAITVFPIQEGVIFNENEDNSFHDERLVIMPLMQQNFFAGTSIARQHHSVNPNEDEFERDREVEGERGLTMSLEFGSNSSLDTANYDEEELTIQQFGSNSSLDFANGHEEGPTIQQLIRRTTPGATTATPDDGTVAMPVFPIQEGVIFNQAIRDILN